MTISEETYMFAERYAHFSNVHTIYRDLTSGHYTPSVNMNRDVQIPNTDFEMQDVSTTAMFVLYAYFYSMVEDDPQGVNGFRVWRASWPEEEPAIAAVESLVNPLVPRLKLFRNRLGFHGSRSRSHEARAFDIFAQHSGTAVWEAMASFKSLGAKLFKKETDRQNGIDPSPTARAWIDEIEAKCKAAATVTSSKKDLALRRVVV